MNLIFKEYRVRCIYEDGGIHPIEYNTDLIKLYDMCDCNGCDSFQYFDEESKKWKDIKFNVRYSFDEEVYCKWIVALTQDNLTIAEGFGEEH